MFEGHGPERKSEIAAALARFQRVLARKGVNLRLRPGGEVHFAKGLLDKLQAGTLPMLDEHGKYLLWDLTTIEPVAAALDLIPHLRAAGVTPIIAHPERYPFVQERPELAGQWFAAGAWLQVTAAALLGERSRREAESAEALCRRGWVHLLGSDAHRPAALPILTAGVEAMARLVGRERAQAMVTTVPAAILAGGDAAAALPPMP
jgi:protein-tyrosine phosphatase